MFECRVTNFINAQVSLGVFNVFNVLFLFFNFNKKLEKVVSYEYLVFLKDFA